jgi:hypothetical protein
MNIVLDLTRIELQRILDALETEARQCETYAQAGSNAYWKARIEECRDLANRIAKAYCDALLSDEKSKQPIPNFRKRFAGAPKGPKLEGGLVQSILEEREDSR